MVHRTVLHIGGCCYCTTKAVSCSTSLNNNVFFKGSSRTKVGGVPHETFITVLIHKDDKLQNFQYIKEVMIGLYVSYE